MAILNFFFPGNLANSGQFFHEKILCTAQNHIFQVKICQIFTIKKTLNWANATLTS
jgi:hypothetical protein